MFYFLSLFGGVLITSTIFFNGRLAQTHSLHLSTVIIHTAGLLLITFIVLIMRDKPFAKLQKWYLYLGGAIGVGIVICNNIAFGKIGVSAILALILLGQSVASLAIDQFGLMGMQKNPFRKNKIIGLLLIISGIIVLMIGQLHILPALASLLAGICIVIARTLNAKLADKIGVRNSTFFNYFVGLSVAILVYVILTGRGVALELSSFEFSPNVYIYLGGMIGMCFIAINNTIVTKIPAFYLTLLIFTGQVFSGVLIDTLMDGAFSSQVLSGGILVALGLCVDLIFDKRMKAKKELPT